MIQTGQSHRARLRAIAIRVMRERGLDPEFPADALAEVAALTRAPRTTEETVRDLRTLLWCSIDNDESRDLDQLSVAEVLPGGVVKVLVSIADVDDRYGLLADVRLDRRAYVVPLCELEATDTTSTNYQPLNDYVVWYANR